jgi:hypothetical protein
VQVQVQQQVQRQVLQQRVQEQQQEREELLFYRKRPKQQPTKLPRGVIFSWGFLKNGSKNFVVCHMLWSTTATCNRADGLKLLQLSRLL